ncbi:hypothetical protein D3C72_2546950 [compost metagenome]
MTFDHGCDERFLAGEVLVKRTDADACYISDPVGAGLVESLLDQNASSRLDERGNCRA